MALTPFTSPVEPAPPRPPGYGFLAAVPVVDSGGVRWEGGVEWLPQSCTIGGALALDCPAGSDEMVLPVAPGTVEALPFVVWAPDACSTLGSVQRDWQGRARALLSATESFLVAAEVWDGAIADAESLPNVPLASAGADILTAAAESPVDALGCIEGGIAGAGFGARGMVHVTPQVLVHLVAAGAVVREGQLWVTPLGSIVVSDAGYSGNGPAADADGTSQWIYGTSSMRYRLSPVFTVPGDDDQPSAGIVVAVNSAEVYAMRAVLVEWDPCVHVAAQVNVGLCTGA